MSLKTENPLLFRAMHTAAKSMPGGVTALVCLVGVLFYLAHRNSDYPSDEG